MNVPVQVSIPLDLAVEVRDRLAKLQKAHDVQLNQAVQRAALSPDDRDMLAAVETLRARSPQLILRNLLSLLIVFGLPALDKAKPADVLAKLTSDAPKRGRPSARG